MKHAFRWLTRHKLQKAYEHNFNEWQRLIDNHCGNIAVAHLKAMEDIALAIDALEEAK
jgi:hypothetical protein